MDNKFSVLKLDIFDSFTCIGGDCKFNCCQGGWTIYWSNEEFNHTLELKEIKKNMPIEFRDAFTDLRNGFMEIKVDCNGNCTLMDGNGWCTVQKVANHNALSHTCRSFPRRLMENNLSFEMTLSTACEVVNQMLLSKEDDLSFLESSVDKMSVNAKADICDVHLHSSRFKNNNSYKYHKDIRILAIKILKDKKYTIEQRVIAIGAAMELITRLVKMGQEDNIPLFSQSFIEEDMIGKFAQSQDELNNIEINNESLRYLSELLKNNKYAEKIFEKGMQNYKEKKDKCRDLYVGFMKENEKYLENLLILNFINLNIPFTDEGKSLFENYYIYVVYFSTLKTLITINLREGFSKEDLIELVVVHTRSIVHSRDIASDIYNIRMNSNATNLDEVKKIL